MKIEIFFWGSVIFMSFFYVELNILMLWFFGHLSKFMYYCVIIDRAVLL